jgi:hypothetical protein
MPKPAGSRESRPQAAANDDEHQPDAANAAAGSDGDTKRRTMPKPAGSSKSGPRASRTAAVDWEQQPDGADAAAGSDGDTRRRGSGVQYWAVGTPAAGGAERRLATKATIGQIRRWAAESRELLDDGYRDVWFARVKRVEI